MISISMSNVPLAQLSHIHRMPSVCLAYKPYIRIRTSFLGILRKQGSYGHEKPGNLKMHFPGRGKVMDFRKNGRGHGKVMEIHLFGPSVSRCLKTGNNFLDIKQKYSSKRLGFQHFLVMEN